MAGAGAEGKFFRIRSEMNGFALEVKGAENSAGACVVTAAADRHGKAESENCQLWYQDQIAGTIRSKLNDYCIDLDPEGRVIVTPLVEERPEQQWMRADMQIQNRMDDNQVIEIAQSNESPGARLHANGRVEQDSQDWSFEYEAPRYFFIRSKMSGRVVDIKRAKKTPGAKVVLWKQKNKPEDNQLWYEDKNGIIRSKLNDFVIEKSAGSSDISMAKFEYGNDRQMWVVSNSFMLNVLDRQMALDVKGAKKSDGAELCAFALHGQPNQLFQFDYTD